MKWILRVSILMIASSCLGQVKFQGVKLEGIHTFYGPADISSLSNWWAPESPVILDTVGTNTYSSWFDLKDQKTLSFPTKASQATQIFLTNTVSGKIYPALRFDGQNDRLTNDAVASMFTGNDTAVSFFMVVRPIDSANTGFVTLGSSAASGVSSNQFLFKPFQGAVNFRTTRTDNTGTVVNVSQTTVTSNAFQFMAFSFTGTRITTSLNGVLQDTAMNTAQMDVDTFTIGTLNRAGSFFAAYRGDMVEMATFGGAIGTNALNSLYLYYAKPKYNLP